MTQDEQERFEERAAILEYDAGYTRVEAERLAREMVNPQPKKQKQEKLWTYI